MYDIDSDLTWTDPIRRSDYVRHLTRTLLGDLDARGTTARIPRVIVQFWNDPYGVPTDVRLCMDSWAVLERQGFRHEVYGDRSARRFIESAFGAPQAQVFDACPHPAMRSDYFRLCYMAQAGGVYVDADDVYRGVDLEPFLRDGRLRVQPLCADRVVGGMTTIPFALSVDDPGRFIHYVANTPLIAPPRHPVIVHALATATAAIQAHERGPLNVHELTGPGNLTRALARYAIEQERAGAPIDVEILHSWDDIAEWRWSLSYRYDERNWRLWRQST